MTTLHTPGPWKVARYNYNTAYAEIETVQRGTDLPDRGYEIAHVSAVNENDANASLIAAAPELLEALHQILNSFVIAPEDKNNVKGNLAKCHVFDHNPEVRHAFNNALAAIAKAEGK